MKQVLAALCIYALACSSVGAQTKTGRDIHGLAGPVKTLHIKNFEAPLLEGRPGLPKERQQRLITFDVNGYETEQDLYGRDGALFKKWLYGYDANGYKSEESSYEASGKLEWRKTFRYEFNARGNVSTLSIYDSDGTLDARMVKTYNERGLQTDNTTYDSKGSVSNKSLFRFDDKGVLTEFALYNSAGVLVQKQVPNSGQNEMILNNDDGTFKRREVRSTPTREDLDSHGNWTKQTTKKVVTQSGRTEEVLEITQRIIAYY
jgi:hypothetical protein